MRTIYIRPAAIPEDMRSSAIRIQENDNRGARRRGNSSRVPMDDNYRKPCRAACDSRSSSIPNKITKTISNSASVAIKLHQGGKGEEGYGLGNKRGIDEK